MSIRAIDVTIAAPGNLPDIADRALESFRVVEVSHSWIIVVDGVVIERLLDARWQVVVDSLRLCHAFLGTGCLARDVVDFAIVEVDIGIEFGSKRDATSGSWRGSWCGELTTIIFRWRR